MIDKWQIRTSVGSGGRMIVKNLVAIKCKKVASTSDSKLKGDRNMKIFKAKNMYKTTNNLYAIK